MNNVALVPVPQQSDSVIPPLHTYIHLFFIKLFAQLGYYITLSRVPCAIQKVLAGCPFKHGSGGSVHVALPTGLLCSSLCPASGLLPGASPSRQPCAVPTLSSSPGLHSLYQRPLGGTGP